MDIQKIIRVISHYEQFAKILVLPCAFTSKHVFPYWMDHMVKLVNEGDGNVQRVQLWDVTEENNRKNDDGAYVEMMMPCKDYALVCEDLFANRRLSVGDEIELYWDAISHNFKFKLIKKGLV